MKVASIVTAFALLAIACTTTTTTTSTPPAGGNGSDAGSEGGKSDKADASKGNEDEEEDPPAETGCGDETSQQACAQCCATEYPDGYAVYSGAVQECVCEADNCADDCADTLCAAQPKNPDAKCGTCADSKQQACGDALTKACNASQDCMAFYQCVVDSGCLDKQ